MKARIDLRYEAKDVARIKSRLSVPEGANFTSDFKSATEQAVLEVLGQNSLTLRTEIEKRLYSMGYAVKKPVYQKFLDDHCKEVYATEFVIGPNVVLKGE